MLFHSEKHKIHQTWFLFAYAWPVNFHCVRFVIVSHLDSCSGPVGEFLAPPVDTAFPLLTLWEQGGRASQMVFLRNYYVLIHCEGACFTLPLLPSYWEVTVRLTVQRECMKNREEGG